jgi:phosphate transport system substrate-binding protein
MLNRRLSVRLRNRLALFTGTLLALLVSLAPTAGSVGAQSVDLNGAGATFPAPLYTKLFDVYAGQTGVLVNYQAVGSGAGIKGITDRTVDFGASDGIMTDAQEAAAPGILHIPMTSGAVAIISNLPGVANGQLHLTPDVLADIYLGTITKWNDPAITAINPSLALPAMDIAVVSRSDGSGTTFIFTNYLSKVSPTWATKVGNASAVNWPTGQSGKGNQGVAGTVQQTAGGIGYVELAYAVQNSLPYATLWNASGNWVGPSVATTAAAASGVVLPDNMKVLITNSPNPGAYPIAGFTWILVYQEQPDMAKGKKLVDLLWWMTHDGQAYTSDLLYTPPSPEARAKAEAQIRSITSGGMPLLGM